MFIFFLFSLLVRVQKAAYYLQLQVIQEIANENAAGISKMIEI